jgi:hypothetical protein
MRVFDLSEREIVKSRPLISSESILEERLPKAWKMGSRWESNEKGVQGSSIYQKAFHYISIVESMSIRSKVKNIDHLSIM